MYKRCTPVFTPTTATTATRYSITTRSQVAMATFLFRASRRCSRKPNRDLFVSIESEGGASQFIKLKLRAKPRKEDEAWSDWITAMERADLSPVPEPERIAVRYRVHPED